MSGGDTPSPSVRFPLTQHEEAIGIPPRFLKAGDDSVNVDPKDPAVGSIAEAHSRRATVRRSLSASRSCLALLAAKLLPALRRADSLIRSLLTRSRNDSNCLSASSPPSHNPWRRSQTTPSRAMRARGCGAPSPWASLASERISGKSAASKVAAKTAMR